MIQMLPVPPERLPDFCREHLPGHTGPVRAYTACQGTVPLGWCAVGPGEPCPILGVEAEDPFLADGLLRAALFPLYEGGAKQYRFLAPPPLKLPDRYVTAGTGALAELFAPCSKQEETNHE